MNRAARAIGRLEVTLRPPQESMAPLEAPLLADATARGELVAFLKSKLDDYPPGAVSRERLEDVIRELSQAESAG